MTSETVLSVYSSAPDTMRKSSAAFGCDCACRSGSVRVLKCCRMQADLHANELEQAVLAVHDARLLAEHAVEYLRDGVREREREYHEEARDPDRVRAHRQALPAACIRAARWSE